MTDQHHPITPPPELVEQWIKDANHNESMFAQVAIMGAHWGSDQELEACCDWFQEFYKTESWVKHDLKHFRDARRPKPPRLKEQALQAAQRFYANGHEDCNDEEVKDDFDIIRRAIESLPN